MVRTGSLLYTMLAGPPDDMDAWNFGQNATASGEQLWFSEHIGWFTVFGYTLISMIIIVNLLIAQVGLCN